MKDSKPPQRRSALKPALYVATFATVAGAGIMLPEEQYSQFTQKVTEVASPYFKQEDIAVPIDSQMLEKHSFPICDSPERFTCIVDGDTIWLKGEKIRLEGIDAPERVNPDCYKEGKLAKRATLALQAILKDTEFRITRNGLDRYGRTLGTLWMGKVSASEMLIRLELAQPWRGSKANWC